MNRISKNRSGTGTAGIQQNCLLMSEQLSLQFFVAEACTETNISCENHFKPHKLRLRLEMSSANECTFFFLAVIAFQILLFSPNPKSYLYFNLVSVEMNIYSKTFWYKSCPPKRGTSQHTFQE